jgi:hypothetical protein
LDPPPPTLMSACVGRLRKSFTSRGKEVIIEEGGGIGAKKDDSKESMGLFLYIPSTELSISNASGRGGDASQASPPPPAFQTALSQEG